MSLTIRPVAPEDRADWSRLWDDYLAFYGLTRGPDVHDATWARILDSQEQMFSLLAEKDGRTIGLANYLLHRSFWDIEPRCYLNDLYVDPDVRGTGAGRALIEALHAHVRDLGAVSTYWLTAEDNDPARRLYDTLADRTPFVHYRKV
ncbi:GNAT family N-acetyltransferase [Aliiroseovarius sp.]|uniref:GNAT family N-acetyltransferase n=1 Tax=Aliiroseovarius sp. TaxID=1872442 RepID=UPI002625674B|nr:GNAT family N-acetyltransferase [Aliiroseovarius sp.]